MNIVAYLFEGSYNGKSSVQYVAPIVGAHHKGILFLRQETEEPQWVLANDALQKFGFSPASVLRSGPLSVESLNTPQFSGFAGRYEKAHKQGESLAWYP
jgi:hypothetical protein